MPADPHVPSQSRQPQAPPLSFPSAQAAPEPPPAPPGRLPAAVRAAKWVAAHRKFLAALVGGAAAVAVAIWGTNQAWVTALILLASALGVHVVPNKPA